MRLELPMRSQSTWESCETHPSMDLSLGALVLGRAVPLICLGHTCKTTSLHTPSRAGAGTGAALPQEPTSCLLHTVFCHVKNFHCLLKFWKMNQCRRKSATISLKCTVLSLIFQLYANVKAMHIQWKLCFEF